MSERMTKSAAEERLEVFLQQVQGLAEAAAETAEALRDAGFGFMAERLESALADLAETPNLQVSK